MTIHFIFRTGGYSWMPRVSFGMNWNKGRLRFLKLITLCFLPVYDCAAFCVYFLFHCLLHLNISPVFLFTALVWSSLANCRYSVLLWRPFYFNLSRPPDGWDDVLLLLWSCRGESNSFFMKYMCLFSDYFCAAAFIYLLPSFIACCGWK